MDDICPKCGSKSIKRDNDAEPGDIFFHEWVYCLDCDNYSDRKYGVEQHDTQ